MEKEAKLEAFWKAYREFVDAVEPEKPFYPQRIFDELLAVSRVLRSEADEYAILEPRGKDYWDRAQKKREAIDRHVDRICLEIRRRLGLNADSEDKSGP